MYPDHPHLQHPFTFTPPLRFAPNEVPNPSFAYDTAGSAPALWTTAVGGGFLAAGAVATVTKTQPRIGSQDLQVVTTATAANEGVQTQPIAPPGGWVAGTSYAFSVYLRGNVGG